MRFKHQLTSTGVALAIAAAGFPAAAQAMYAEHPAVPFAAAPASVSSATPYVQPTNRITDAGTASHDIAQVSSPSVQQTSSGFDWGDAGIGAAGATVLLGAAGLLGTGVMRRRPVVG